MHLSSLKSFDWDSPVFLLSLLALLLFTYSALRSAGIKPMNLLTQRWQLTRQRFNGLNFGWRGVVAQTKRLGINCAVAIVFFALGAGWQAHRYALGIKSEKARELEKWKREYGEYQRVYTAWLKQHQELNPPGGDQ